MAAIVLVVVLALVGVGTFVLMGGTMKAPPVTCAPITSPQCGVFVNLHDVSVLVPFKTASQGVPVGVTATVPQGETATSYTFDFGDGSPLVKSTNSIVTHTYTSAGRYLISAQAQVGAQVHDNMAGLVVLGVSPSYSGNNNGATAPVTAAILGNSTTPSGSRGATAVLAATQSVTVSGTYSSSPSNPAFVLDKPAIVVSTGGHITTSNTTGTSASATASFPTAGSYQLTFVGSASSHNATVYQNYTWTVYVAPPGQHAGILGTVAPKSPHPGTIVAYELAPGGAASEDPAIDYETVGAEPIFNVYQTLITYNGTDVGPTAVNYVPEAATCVPGSAQCVGLYQKSLQNGTDYTFVIQRNATFYDPTTGAYWGMWPTDVVFSIARTLGFSTLPFATAHPGWILAQALLSPGNVTWNLLHGAYNNTPQNILNSMTINGTDCPSIAMSQDHGCVTFHANGGGKTWPDFLELISDPLGAGIVPCGWFSAKGQGAGIPYWSRGNITGPGDQPCWESGTHGFGNNAATTPITGWDQWEQLGSGAFNGQYLGNVQWSLAGSGPYYMANYFIASAYTLMANPHYSQNPYCTWTGCQPAKNQYAGTIEVTWETSATPGEQAYRFGSADFASVPSTDLGLLLQLIQQGKVNAIQSPTLNIGFDAFNMLFNLAGAQRFTTNAITIPTDFFSYLGVREFFSRAYPYTTIQDTINTKDGIQLSFPEGGAIPQFMGNFYPSNIPWPSKDPCQDKTDPSCPAYWWSQMQNLSSPYYDQEVTRCSAGNPCQLPLFGQTGNPTGDQINSIWSSELATLSGGALKVSPVDLNFVDIVNAQSSVAGSNPLPLYGLGWAPDYPDPTDYVVPLYASNSTYTAGDAVAQSLEQTQFAQGCAYGPKDFQHWSNVTAIPQSCQGVAYRALNAALGTAAYEANLTKRIQYYDQAEMIAYNLCLYLYSGQGNAIPNFSSWVDINSVNTNVMTGGDATWYSLTGNGVQYSGST